MPLVIHPEAGRDRKVVFSTGAELHLPSPILENLEREGIAIAEECQPRLLIDGAVLVSGQVEQVTDFEKDLPLNYARLDGA